MSPDLAQNTVTTIYLLFSHNYIAFIYLTGVVIGIGLSLYRPSRFATLILIGFAVLLFSFEYDKHIISGLREQTINSLITDKPHYRLQRIVDVSISELAPIVFYLLGWCMIFVAIVMEGRKEKRIKKVTTDEKIRQNK